ncbi:type II toxin-antitoxin system RelE/ParE family toxin [Burkholderia sp. S171]|uniref:type II toxin-antitoxin system RelE/ParE family toxin n=1 Tax=Burkholderia sp. S171 TaxID=1641860 RepID=UPI00131D51EA|nr:type II toxin-antitoxin system RelE/ParE family toxin [Burkholderia sp. S171]
MQPPAQRFFKTVWFSRAANSAGITYGDLCKAAKQLMAGQGDDLGGNGWKKRLDRNTKRRLVLNKVGRRWIFVFLFAKSDMDNIGDIDLKKFKRLAKDYGSKTSGDIDVLVDLRELLEICNG